MVTPVGIRVKFAFTIIGYSQDIAVKARVGILKQNAKSWYSGITVFEVRRNSKTFFFVQIFLTSALYITFSLSE